MPFQRLPLDQFPEKLRRHVDLKSPPPMRLMGARGAVPAAPGELAMMLFQLSLDQDQQIAKTARQTMQGLPEDIVKTAASSSIPPAALDFIGHERSGDTEIIETLLLNRETPDETFVRLARSVSTRTAQMIAENEVRILRTPEIIESLYLNENTLMSTVDRMLDLAKRNNVSFSGIPVLQQMMEDQRYDTSAIVREHEEKDGEEDELFAQILQESLREEELEDSTEDADKDEKDDDEHRGNRQTYISTLSVSEKVRLGTLGSKEDRKILVRDTNRLVHMAAAQSPKVQIDEIASWAGNKSLPDGVIGFIANNREFRRNYQIVLALVNNPKTPLKHSMQLLNHVRANDLRSLLRNRDIPHQLRRAAKNLKTTREGGRG